MECLRFAESPGDVVKLRRARASGRFYRKLAFDDLNPVAEDVVNVAADSSRKRVIRSDFHPGLPQLGDQRFVVSAPQCGMSLLGRTEVGLDAQMNLHATAGEPASASLGELRRLGDLRHAQHLAVETASRRFFAFGHGQLNVIVRGEWLAHSISVTQVEPRGFTDQTDE